MKMTTSARIAVLSLVGFAIPLTGQCQTYTLSTPISGYLTMSAKDTTTGSSGGGTYTFTTLNETVYINPIAQTIEQWGTISGTLSAPNFSFQDIEIVSITTNNYFPNPPTYTTNSIIGNVTVALAPAGNGISFDTGSRPLSWNGSLEAYTVDSNIKNLGLFNGAYSLVTGGQTYSGNFTYEITRYGGNNAYTFNQLATAGYPNAITLSGLGCGEGCSYQSGVSTVAVVNASNGFIMTLHEGCIINAGLGGELFLWNSPGTITATEVVPEPTTLSLLAFGIFGTIFLRRRSS